MNIRGGALHSRRFEADVGCSASPEFPVTATESAVHIILNSYMFSSGLTDIWPNCYRFAHPKSGELPLDFVEHEAFSMVDAVVDGLSGLDRKFN